jgi:hypothetical protein
MNHEFLTNHSAAAATKGVSALALGSLLTWALRSASSPSGALPSKMGANDWGRPTNRAGTLPG